MVSPIGDKTVFEGNLLSFTVIATDTDLPVQVLTFSLNPGAPAAATIEPITGLFTWIAPEVPTPTTSTITVIVSDNGFPSLSATQSFNVTVLKTNHPPVFLPASNYLAQVLIPLRVTNVVTDPDIPTNHITFGLMGAAPKGTRINKFTGLVIWTPSRAQARSTNSISVVATDNGLPALSATNTFQVMVEDYLELSLGRLVIRAGQTGSVLITVTNTTGVTNLSSSLLVPTERLADLSIIGLAAGLQSGTVAAESPGISQLNFSTSNGQILQPGQLLAQLNFTAISTQSAFVPLIISNVISIQSNGVPVARTLAEAGRVVVIANEPLVEPLFSTNQPMLVLYGQPGWTNVVQATTDPSGRSSSWQNVWEGTLTNLSEVIQPAVPINRMLFFRSFKR